ncbi:MAG TPA: hypothetical protein VGE72_04080 [Azospirillum sp.]
MNKIVDIATMSPALADYVQHLPVGETVLVKDGDRVVAALSRIDTPVPPRPARTPGRMAGRIRMAPDFDETPEEVIEAIEAPIDPNIHRP